MKDKETRKIENVDGTPFAIVTENDECTIVMGNNIMLKQTFKNKEEAICHIQRKPYDLLIPMIGIIAQMVFEDLTTNKNK